MNKSVFEAKMDTGLLLLIESSIQNNDLDILCALRESLFNLTKQNETARGEFVTAITYIDQLHQCIPNKEEISTASENLDYDDSFFEEGNIYN